MITSPFIEFDTHPGTVLNVAHIVSVEKTAGPVSGKKRKAYEALGMSATVVHTIRICLVGRKALELAFDSESQCTAMFKMVKMALTPRAIPKPGLSASAARGRAIKKAGPIRTSQKPPEGEQAAE